MLKKQLSLSILGVALSLLFYASSSCASEARISLNINVGFGSHETHTKLGILAFGAVQQSELAFEAGLGVWAQSSLKRFGYSSLTWSAGYETFGSLGYGDNSDLLGSGISSLKNQTFFANNNSNSFLGIGLGISNEWGSDNLNEILHKTGKVYLRFAKNDNSYHVVFANDVNAGFLINGAGKDYGETASGEFGFTTAKLNTIQHYFAGFAFFTPKPDFNKEPNNPINSDEGRKRVWFTQEPLKDVFNGNFYFSTTQIKDGYAWGATLGIDSNKLAATIQNDIHDEFGLVPRFPWPIDEKDTLLWNVSVSAVTGNFE